jgi:NAD(P)-dependent dehydrogenase (short-subunit alcohol dehydrogenase family)
VTNEERRVAFVTGGGRGIGENIARGLAANGWSVIVGARTVEEVEQVAAEIDGRAVRLDVTSSDLVAEAFAGAGTIDLLVNNAGWAGPLRQTSWEIDPDQWWQVFEINVRGAFLSSRAVLPQMIARQEGCIVNVGSGAAYFAAPGIPSAYSASKAAMHRFAEVLAQEVAPFGISVFSISPGRVRTSAVPPWADVGPWTPTNLAPDLVCKLATGRYDELSGRFLDAAHDDVDDIMARIGEVHQRDLYAVRLRKT